MKQGLDEQFAREVYRTLVLDFAEERVRSFALADPEQITDPRFAEIAAFYRGLSDDQKAGFAATVRQTAVDALASLFAVVQGSAALEGFTDEAFTLAYGSAPIGADLADLFLAEDEEQGPDGGG
jgi:hypothetical protein